MTLSEAIMQLESFVEDPTQGIPDELFRFICRLTPQVNVDLLIRDEHNRVLLTWRNDFRDGCVGWHFPGGMIRLKEKAIERVRKVASLELECAVSCSEHPLCVNEIIFPEKKERSHGYSLLFECHLETLPPERLKFQGGTPVAGVYNWFATPPEQLVSVHDIYKNFFSK